jgi:UDPglucose--hexose-1-phosphate uridylyltransferase
VTYELRQNPATKEWAIIAPVRAKRPQELVTPTRPLTGEGPEREPRCPFCPGNEEPEWEILRIPEQGPWQLRVLRNKLPALQQEGEREFSSEGIHRRVSGVGRHEVLIESPLHNTCAALESPTQVAQVLRAFQHRGRIIAQDPRVEHIVFFENHGPQAGTTLAHPHAQLVGLPVVPYDIQVRSDQAGRHFTDTGQCVYCQTWAEAVRDGRRIVVESELFVALVPYAAGSPFHTWILPRRHEASFLNATEQELAELGLVLQRVLRKLYVGLHDPDYNYIIRSAPMHATGEAHLHWYLAIVPRATRATGFELGSGVLVNTALPEDSAAFLRSVQEGV